MILFLSEWDTLPPPLRKLLRLFGLPPLKVQECIVSFFGLFLLGLRSVFSRSPFVDFFGCYSGLCSFPFPLAGQYRSLFKKTSDAQRDSFPFLAIIVAFLLKGNGYLFPSPSNPTPVLFSSFRLRDFFGWFFSA